VIAADVSTPDGMLAIVDALRSAALPPLGGVFHAAGRIDDELLVTTAWERFESVLAPKVLGALHLHEATKDLALDHFVCFSSLAAIVGSAGQASYAAANAYLDLLARYRRTRGLPGLSINWGPWEGEGMTACLTAPQRARLRDHGIGMLEPVVALDEMRHVLAGEHAQIVIAAVDWSRVDSSIPSARIAADMTSNSVEQSISHAAPEIRPAADAEAISNLAAWSSLSAAERKPVLTRLLRAALADSLGIEPGELDPDVPLQDIGMDSLMFLDVFSQLSDVDETLDLRDVPAGTTLRTLVDTIIERTATGAQVVPRFGVPSHQIPIE
jgi:hypothetical protein